jgi:hypothetical protein
VRKETSEGDDEISQIGGMLQLKFLSEPVSADFHSTG